MVHVTTPRPSLGAAIGQGFGQGFAESAKEAIDYQRQRGRLQQALQQVSNVANKENATPLEISLSALNAFAGIPGSERYVGQVLPFLIQQATAKRSGQIPTPTEIQEGGTPVTPFQRQQLPQFGQQGAAPTEGAISKASQFFPTNVGPQQAPGNLPQPATAGQVRPVYSPSELMNQAKDLSKVRTNAGIATTVSQAYDELKIINEDNKAYNTQVEADRRARVTSQREYGEKAEKSLTELMPLATAEQRAIFRKIGEDVAGRGVKESEIDRTIAGDARKFVNTISNIKNDLSAPRLQNTIQRKFLGTEKDFNSAANDLRVKLKPILDLGLYDTARNLLKDLGYYPEEREIVINPLDERVKTEINLIPRAKKTTEERKIPKGLSVQAGGIGMPLPSVPQEIYGPEQKENVKEGITRALKESPNVSLVLLRKAFEDKGYDWRIFKDSLNDLLPTIQNQGAIQLNDDQQNQLEYLDSPPLNLLEKFLHKLKIIGR